MNREDFLFSDSTDTSSQPPASNQRQSEPSISGGGGGGYKYPNFIVYCLIGFVILLLIVLGYILYTSYGTQNTTSQHGPPGQYPGQPNHPNQQGMRRPAPKAKKMPDVSMPEQDTDMASKAASAKRDEWIAARTRAKQKIEIAKSINKQPAQHAQAQQYSQDEQDNTEYTEQYDTDYIEEMNTPGATMVDRNTYVMNDGAEIVDEE